MKILAIHGINTGADDPVAELWEHTLRDSGLPCEVAEARWRSTGTVIGDVAAFSAPGYTLRTLEDVCDGLREFAYTGGGVLLSHSMGTVLLIQAERLLRTGLPIVCLASPLSNPAIAKALMAVGLGRPPPSRVIHLWNNDDSIPGGKLAKQPGYFNDTRIAVADNDLEGAESEHDVRLYLRHLHVHNAIKVAWEGIASDRED